MLQQKIEWHFKPHLASHMGGAFERMIRTTRPILKAFANEQLLTDEQLLSKMTEVETILNDRPITSISDDLSDQPPLTHITFDEDEFMDSTRYLQERRRKC